MADIQFTISEEKIQAMLFGERGTEVLTEELFNQLLQAEMSEHLSVGRSGIGDERLAGAYPSLPDRMSSSHCYPHAPPFRSIPLDNQVAGLHLIKVHRSTRRTHVHVAS